METRRISTAELVCCSLDGGIWAIKESHQLLACVGMFNALEFWISGVLMRMCSCTLSRCVGLFDI